MTTIHRCFFPAITVFVKFVQLFYTHYNSPQNYRAEKSK